MMDYKTTKYKISHDGTMDRKNIKCKTPPEFEEPVQNLYKGYIRLLDPILCGSIKLNTMKSMEFNKFIIIMMCTTSII